MDSQPQTSLAQAASATAPSDSALLLFDGIRDSQPEPPLPSSPKKPQRKCFKKASTKNVSVVAETESVDTANLTASSRSSKQSPASKGLLNDNVVKKTKEKSLTYVNYLNAFSNSLTIHPPAKRASKSTNSSRSPVDDESGISGFTEIDFDTGGKIGSIVPYLPDYDRDRCSHLDNFCPFSKREGYVYCEKHLLDDKALPFVPCAYQRTESNPCPYPARMPPGAGGKNRPQRSKEALCILHIEQCMQEVHNHMKSSANSILSTMDDLGQYNINPDKGLPPTNSPDMLDDLAETQTRENLETYLRATAKDTYATGSSSDGAVVDEGQLNLHTSRTFDTDDEIDSDDDPTKYAHLFTAEELVRMLRLKMAKQKELLAFEIKLQEYKLKDARATYLEDVAAERTFLPSVSLQARSDPQSLRSYRTLRTMLRFNRRRPRFTFANARRPCVKVKSNSAKLPESVSRCYHLESATVGKPVKCRQFSLPFSRHCMAHILEDQYQYLYKKCAANFPKQCSNPVLKNMGTKFCGLHIDMTNVPNAPNLDETQTLSSDTEDDLASTEVPLAPELALPQTPVPHLDSPVLIAPKPKRQYIRKIRPLARPKNPRKAPSKKKKKKNVEQAHVTLDLDIKQEDSPEIAVVQSALKSEEAAE